MAPVTFFDQTPVGRIVNRFTSDFQTIDREISFNFVGVARSILDLISAFAVILYVLPAFLLWMAPMLWFYYKTQKVYRKTAREMKRLSSTPAARYSSISMRQSMVSSRCARLVKRSAFRIRAVPTSTSSPVRSCVKPPLAAGFLFGCKASAL